MQINNDRVSPGGIMIPNSNKWHMIKVKGSLPFEYARTEADAIKLNATRSKPEGLIFKVR